MNDERQAPEFAKGGYITAPDGSDSIPFFPFEREAIIDRHGNVICRYIGGRRVPQAMIDLALSDPRVDPLGPPP